MQRPVSPDRGCKQPRGDPVELDVAQANALDVLAGAVPDPAEHGVLTAAGRHHRAEIVHRRPRRPRAQLAALSRNGGLSFLAMMFRRAVVTPALAPLRGAPSPTGVLA